MRFFQWNPPCILISLFPNLIKIFKCFMSFTISTLLYVLNSFAVAWSANISVAATNRTRQNKADLAGPLSNLPQWNVSANKQRFLMNAVGRVGTNTSLIVQYIKGEEKKFCNSETWSASSLPDSKLGSSSCKEIIKSLLSWITWRNFFRRNSSGK